MLRSACDSLRSRPPLDRARTSVLERAVPPGLRPELRTITRPSANAIPNRLADDPRPRLPAHRRADRRPDRQPDRLRLAERLLRGVPPTPRTASGPVAARRAGQTA